MRYPEPLKKGGTIGFIAPSFGCAIEPYKSRFENAMKIFREMGYQLKLGPNCYESSGLGISNSPDKCGDELNKAMTDDESDVIITCGGGELMCEVVPYIDFEQIKNAKPKWYMGYSDNTNYTFLSTILADTAAIYGPCAPAFGRVPWHSSVEDALKLLTGEISSVSGYDLWENDNYVEESGDTDPDELELKEDSLSGTESVEEEPDPLLPYNVNTPVEYKYFNTPDSGARFSGRLIGGCVDILTVLVGTKYDKVDEFLEKYKDDGFIWFLECCDLGPLSIRRAFWTLREAGWFKYAKGFLIGRPLHFGENEIGVDQYNAVMDILKEMDVPVIMDLDIGHLPPMMPMISGSVAEVSASGNDINIDYKFI